MRIECPVCKKTAHTKMRNKISKHLTEVYGSCLDPFCGASFVTSIAFKNSIANSNDKVNFSLKKLISKMSEEEYSDVISAR